MTKLNRLIKKCIEQNNPNTGTAESFNNSLSDLGRWVLSLYLNGNLNTENFLGEDEQLHENINIKEFIKVLGETAIKNGFFKDRERTFIEQLALCHSGLSKAMDEYQKGYHPSYTYYRKDNEPLGIPSDLGTVIIRVFIMCHHYEIDMESVLLEKYEYYKHKKSNYRKKLI